MRIEKSFQHKIRILVILVLLGISGTVAAQHTQMDHKPSSLSMPGNDIFGTIQEVVQKLEADPDTDWTKVDLEALRQHLLDMKAFTEEVKVILEKPIAHGVEILVKPETKRASTALEHVMHMHPMMLKKEKGWEMNAKKEGDHWKISCTTSKEEEVEKIRGLGYIGLLAEGAHHQLHHWMLATGNAVMK